MQHTATRAARVLDSETARDAIAAGLADVADELEEKRAAARATFETLAAARRRRATFELVQQHAHRYQLAELELARTIAAA